MEVKEPSAKYLARRGYKQTDWGEIPKDWEVKRLGDLATIAAGGTPSRANPKYWDGEIPWVTTSEVDFCTITNTEQFITKEGLVNSPAKLLSPGTLLMALYGQGKTRGKVGVLGIEAATNQACAAISIDREVSVEFIFHFLGSQYEAIRKLSNTGNQENLNSSLVRSIPVFLPTKTEQKAIAEALSDADALIESLEQLLAKKRHLKQAAMQELLLPKPSDETRLLGEVSSLKGRIGWQGLKQSEFTTNDDEPFLITGMNFKDGAIRWNEVYHISEARYEMAPEIQLRPHDVLMTKDGTIGKVLYIDSIPYPGKASLNSHLLLFRPIKGSYHQKYLYYQLGSKRFKDFVELTKSGTTFFGLSQTAVAGYPVILPPLTEQVRIASVLTDMDADIAELEAKLAKARQIKQGMMQELLTGRIRLV